MVVLDKARNTLLERRELLVTSSPLQRQSYRIA